MSYPLYCLKCGVDFGPEGTFEHYRKVNEETGKSGQEICKSCLKTELLGPPLLNNEERLALDYLGRTHKTIMETFKLQKGNNLEIELNTLIHGIQGFIIQHMLQRLGSPDISRWYND